MGSTHPSGSLAAPVVQRGYASQSGMPKARHGRACMSPSPPMRHPHERVTEVQFLRHFALSSESHRCLGYRVDSQEVGRPAVWISSHTGLADTNPRGGGYGARLWQGSNPPTWVELYTQLLN